MKKTISVNIKGFNFLIEEEAYEILHQYLERLKAGLKIEKGGDDILEDIELRIAELFGQLLNDKKQVIEYTDVQHILSTLGNPEQFLNEDEENTSNEYRFERNANAYERKLFRDADNDVIAGVCAGLANYFNVDVVFIRIIFVLLFFLAGAIIPIYIILWIVIPKAKTSIDKLKMHGRPVTVENLKDEVENAAKNFSSKSKKMAQKFKEDFDAKRRFSQAGRILSKIMGGFLLLIGLGTLIWFLVFFVFKFQIIPFQSKNGFMSIPDLMHFSLTDQDYFLANIFIYLGAFAFVVFNLLLGVKMFFHLQIKWIKSALGSLFLLMIFSAIGGGVVAAKASRELLIEGEIEKEIAKIDSNSLYINSVMMNAEYNNSFKIKSNGRWGMFGESKDDLVMTGVSFEFNKSKDSSFHIYKNLSANSHSHQKALKLASNIRHRSEVKENQLHIDAQYFFSKKDKLRDQEVEYVIEIPENANVFWNGVLILDNKKNNIVTTDDDTVLEGYVTSEGKFVGWDF